MPFEIPESWAWCRLLDVCHIFGRIGFRGYTKEDLVHSGGAITLSPSNIVNGRMSYDNCTYISWDKYEESPEIQISNNDILLVKTGSSYGKCALVTDLPQAATINPQFVVLKYISYNAALLRYVLQSNYARSNYERFVLGTAIPTFTQVVLGDMLIPLPPANEQIKIIKEIDRWFAIIDEIESGTIELESYVKQTKSKILDHAISGKLVPQDHNDEPAIELLKRINPKFEPCDNSHYENLPQGWSVCRLEDIFNITMGQSPTGESINGENGIEFHQGKIHFGESYLLSSCAYTDQPTKIADVDSLLLCVRAPVGVLNITQRRICIGRGLCALKPKYVTDNLYWLYVLSTYKDYFESNATGSTFKAISGDTIKNTVIKLPPRQEQQRIFNCISSLYELLNIIVAELV